MVLKPQDVYVTLKLASTNSDRAPYSQLAAELGMSPSEVHASIQRAQACHLLHGPALKHRPNLSAIEEFLVHGLKYVFPAVRGGLVRGVPTSYAAEPLRSVIIQGADPIPVWPSDQGKQRGIAFEPLYRSAPSAALKDSRFYEYLILADALRDGRARERNIAATMLRRQFKESDAQPKPKSTHRRSAAFASTA